MRCLESLIFVALLLTFGVAEDSSEDGIAEGTKKTNCTCGWANRMGGRIIGGDEAGVNEFPMMAGLILRRLFRRGVVYEKNLHFCGGTLVTHRHVVTAGHCVHNHEGERLEASDIGVVLGAHNLKKLDYDDPNVMRAPEQLILHPKYVWPAHYDMAIVVLPFVEFSQVIGPACMPIERIDIQAKKLKVIGWGYTSASGPGSDVLKKTNLIGMNHGQCGLLWGTIASSAFETNDPYQVCTFQPGTGQCRGDSGGPIMWVDPQINRYTLVAAPSYGTAMCHTHPSVSSDVTYFAPWIQEVISKTYPEEKTCSRVD